MYILYNIIAKCIDLNWNLHLQFSKSIWLNKYRSAKDYHIDLLNFIMRKDQNFFENYWLSSFLDDLLGNIELGYLSFIDQTEHSNIEIKHSKIKWIYQGYRYNLCIFLYLFE